MSYAHADEAVAAKLHRALETYSVPKNISQKSGKKLTPIFRDVTELTAHHDLSIKIGEAINVSKHLIVLCSPAAKASHWVNEEIRLFRDIHGDGAILCVLCDGTPETSFPPALLEGGREPLAATLGASKDGFRLGVSQLAASLLGVGLDTLVQREAVRKRRRLQLITVAATVFSAVMGVMALTAVNARDAAQTSRSEAEKMVEFMLTDLRKDLEPIGKLDILGNVGNRAADYYDAIANDAMDDDRLARQARARHLLGQVAITQKSMKRAETEILAAHAATQQVLKRNPNDPDAIFAHAQSEYWAGEVYYRQGKSQQTLPYWAEYDALARKLFGIDSNNIDWIMEAGWGQSNLGSVSHRLKDFDKALQYSEEAVRFFDKVLTQKPDNFKALREKSNALHGAAHAAIQIDTRERAVAYMRSTVDIYEKLLQRAPNDYTLRFALIYAKIDLGDYDFRFDYNPIQDLSDLTAYDPKNLVWLKLLHDESYKRALRGLLTNNKSVFLEYAKVFQAADDALTSNEDYKTTRSDIALTSIVSIIENHYKDNGAKARLTLSQVASSFIKSTAKNGDDRARHYDLICVSHQLGETSLRDKLTGFYNGLNVVRAENRNPTILRNKLALAKLKRDNTAIDTLSAILSRKGQMPEGQDCFQSQ